MSARRKAINREQVKSGGKSAAALVVVAGILVVTVVLLIRLRSRTVEGGASSVSRAGSGHGPNVLLVTLDTTRADRIGCYGYEQASTPAIDALAASGVRFEQAMCQVPLTFPSHASLMTGLYPVSLDIHVNGSAILGGKTPTLAERFKEHGYRTGAFVGTLVLNRGYGLNRGFDVYDDYMEIDGKTSVDGSERRGDRVCDAALRWMADRAGAPFFAWINFYDPHYPYDPPAEIRNQVEHPYDGEIAFVDRQIGRLVRWLDENNLRDKTLIVVVGDHGEGLDDPREALHGFFVYRPTMHVPMILSHPGSTTTPRVVAPPVQVADIYPTIAELLGWEAPPDLDGRSLVGAVKGTGDSFGPVYGESEYARTILGCSRLRSLIVDRWLYIEAPQAELYDREADPDGQQNLIGQHDDIATSMSVQLADLVRRAHERIDDTSAAELDAETLAKLASLGYVGSTGGAGDAEDDKGRIDPKSRIEALRTLRKSLHLSELGRPDEALVGLKALSAEHPESTDLHVQLGLVYQSLKRHAEAQREFEAGIAASPPSAPLLCMLADSLRTQGQLAEAIRHFEQSLAIGPNWLPAVRGMAGTYSEQQRFADAEPLWRRCTELDPRSAQCQANLGSVLFLLRRPNEAITPLVQAVTLDPALDAAWTALWQAYEGVGRRADAITTLKSACTQFPDSKEFQCPLAWMIASTQGASPEDATMALQLAVTCADAQPSDARILDILAAARAAKGEFVEAVRVAEEAATLAAQQRDSGLQQQIAQRLEYYRLGKPFQLSRQPR